MTDSVLIVGAGIAGLQAAMQCTRAGARAVVVERGPIVGGHLAAAVTDPGEIAKRAPGAEIPTLAELADGDDIEVITLADVDDIAGRPGNFSVTITERARFVTDTCTRCNHCRSACPVVVPNEYDADLTYRKAIFTPMTETFPAPYVIDIGSCLNTPPNYLPCDRCAQVCDDDSIHFDVPLARRHKRTVGAIVIATGFEMGDSGALAGLGYGAHPDVITSAELQRLLESPGPTGGFASRPSNEDYPESVLLVLDDLSAFGLYIVASQAQQLLAQGIDTVEVLALARPSGGDEVQRLAEQTGLTIRWGGMFKVDEKSTDSLDVAFEDFVAQRHVRASFDLVVLCSDPVPPGGMQRLAGIAGVELNDEGYLASGGADVSTTRDGIYMAGCASGPKSLAASVAQARSAASVALADLNPRLLRPDYAAEEAATPIESDGAESGVRQRIEQMLNALIDAN